MKLPNLPLLRPLSDAEARLSVAVLALWVAFGLAAPVAEQVTALVSAWVSCAANPLCR